MKTGFRKTVTTTTEQLKVIKSFAKLLETFVFLCAKFWNFSFGVRHSNQHLQFLLPAQRRQPTEWHTIFSTTWFYNAISTLIGICCKGTARGSKRRKRFLRLTNSFSTSAWGPSITRRRHLQHLRRLILWINCIFRSVEEFQSNFANI